VKTILTISLHLLAVYASSFAEPGVLTAAVFDFETSGKDKAEVGKQAAVLLNAELSSANHLALVERQELGKVLGEQELGLSGTISTESASAIGKLVGAKVLITGRVIEAGKTNYLVAKVISSETGRVFGKTARFKDQDHLLEAAAVLAKEINEIVGEKHEALVADVESEEELVASLTKLIPEGEKPTISVNVEEEHIGRRVIDPAVETEIKYLLQKLGYTVVDAGADITITGEAFSEFAARFGNLVACRARVEIVVKGNIGSEILFTGRQVSTAADLAENVAGKSALAKAASELMPEIIPKL
jgi:hypothetical protein